MFLEEFKVLSPYDETNSHSDDVQKIFQDYDLSQFKWSVRTSNIFEEANINLLSQLVSLNRHELLRLPNFAESH